MRPIEMVIDILGKTGDGRKLHQTPEERERHGPNGDGQWLKMLETGANGRLNEWGVALLTAFHKHVMADDYDYSLPEFAERFADEINDCGIAAAAVKV